MRFWASQRLVENAFRRFVAYAQGTWLISIWLRCLGAKIGSWVTFRFCNCQVCAQQQSGLVIGWRTVFRGTSRNPALPVI